MDGSTLGDSVQKEGWSNALDSRNACSTLGEATFSKMPRTKMSWIVTSLIWAEWCLGPGCWQCKSSHSCWNFKNYVLWKYLLNSKELWSHHSAKFFITEYAIRELVEISLYKRLKSDEIQAFMDKEMYYHCHVTNDPFLKVFANNRIYCGWMWKWTQRYI